VGAGGSKDRAKGEVWQSVYVIGVRALLYDFAMECTLTADGGPVEAWTMDISKADHLLVETGTLHHLQLGSQIMVLHKSKMFNNLNPEDPRLRSLMMACDTKECWNKEVVIEQNSEGDSFYILMEGSVQIEVDGKVLATQSADLDHSQVYYFGDLAKLEGDIAKRHATVRISSEAANIVNVSTEHINEAFGSLSNLLSEDHIDLEEQKAFGIHEKKHNKKDKVAEMAAKGVEKEQPEKEHKHHHHDDKEKQQKKEKEEKKAVAKAEKDKKKIDLAFVK